MLNDEFEYPSECMICYCEFNNENTPYNLISHDFQCMHIYCFDCINKIDQCSLCRKNKIGITKNILLMQYLKYCLFFFKIEKIPAPSSLVALIKIINVFDPEEI